MIEAAVRVVFIFPPTTLLYHTLGNAHVLGLVEIRYEHIQRLNYQVSSINSELTRIMFDAFNSSKHLFFEGLEFREHIRVVEINDISCTRD